MVLMVVAIALFGRLAQAPRMAGAFGSCMHTASAAQVASRAWARAPRPKPTIVGPRTHVGYWRPEPVWRHVATFELLCIMLPSAASVNSAACWLHCPHLAGARGAGSKVRNSNIELVAPCSALSQAAPLNLHGYGQNGRGWLGGGLPRVKRGGAWRAVTAGCRLHGVAWTSCMASSTPCHAWETLFARSTKCTEFVRSTWCTLTGVYNLTKDCPHNGSCTPHRDLRKHVW